MALAIPLTLAIVFALMLVLGIDMQRISLGALIIALALMVDDAMTTTDATLTRLAAGDDKPTAATFAFRTYAVAMLAGTLVTIAGFVPIGFAASSRRRVLLHPVRRRHHRAARVLAGGGDLRAALGVSILKVPKPGPPPSRRAWCAGIRRFLATALRARWLTIGVTVAMFVAVDPCAAAGAAAVLPGLRPARAAGRPHACRRTRRSSPARRRRTGSTPCSRAIPTSSAGAPMSAAARSASTCRSTCSWPNDFFAQAVIVAKDVAARDRLHAKLEQVLAEEFPTSSPRVYPLELGPPVGWPIQYRVSGPDLGGARDRARSRAGRRRQPRHADDQLRLDRAGARDPDPDRPGPGAPARPELAGTGDGAQYGDHRHAGHPGRDDIYLVNVVARATDEQRVSLATLRDAAGPAARTAAPCR